MSRLRHESDRPLREDEIGVVRSFPRERLLVLLARSVHLVGAGAVTGAILLGLSPLRQGEAFLWLAVATGLLLQADDLYRYGAAYFATGMFWLIAAKLVLLGAALNLPALGLPDAAAGAIVLSVLVSGFVSHMPGAWRHRRLWRPLRSLRSLRSLRPR